MARPVALVLSGERALPPSIDGWLQCSLAATTVACENELIAVALRGHPRLVILDARDAREVREEAMSDRSVMELVPTVVEQTHRGERGWDLFSRLLKDPRARDHARARDVQRALREAHGAIGRDDR